MTAIGGADSGLADTFRKVKKGVSGRFGYQLSSGDTLKFKRSGKKFEDGGKDVISGFSINNKKLSEKRVQKEADNLGWDGAGNVTSNPITLNRKVDKVKLKKKGYVRKTGEGFLGLQNRKKYIDGIEVTKDMPETAYQEQKRKKKEAKKQAKEERKAKNKKIRQKGSKYSGMSASQAQAAKLRDDEAAGLVPKGSYESVYGKS